MLWLYDKKQGTNDGSNTIHGTKKDSRNYPFLSLSAILYLSDFYQALYCLNAGSIGHDDQVNACLQFRDREIQLRGR